MQIQREAISEYLDKTGIPGKQPYKSRCARGFFIEGMQVLTFLLLPGGGSQAAACTGNLYTIDQSVSTVLPGALSF